MSKYAFGLWQYGINTKGVHSNELVVRPAGEFPHGAWIADCGVKTDPKAVANARLIAAAPDMLAVLKDLQESAAYWSELGLTLGIVDRINAVIDKATGGQP